MRSIFIAVVTIEFRKNINREIAWKMSLNDESNIKSVPKVLVFDLDGCVWDPEMYELWGGGGAPFKNLPNGNLSDRSGTTVRLLGDVRQLMYEFKTNTLWSNTVIAVASSCDEPSWAKECIQKFPVGPDGDFKLNDVFSLGHTEIYKGGKDRHLRSIQQKCKNGVTFKDMMFFDNQYDNCNTVAKLGVTVVYTPDGVTRQAFSEALERFPAPGEIIGPKRRGYF